MQSLLPAQEMPKKAEVAEICAVDVLTWLEGKSREAEQGRHTENEYGAETSA